MNNMKKPENNNERKAPDAEAEYASKLSTFATKQIADTENEISKIESQIEIATDDNEKERLEFLLKYLKNKLEIEYN